MVDGFICEYNDKGGLLLQKDQRVEGLLIKNGKVQGGPGKIALLLPLSRDQNSGGGEGGTGGLGRWPWGSVAVRGVGEK